ncbi:GPI inositol-deacylase [Cotesia glomerata]|uniref:GPI inositol-deacylase n=1 Tax=Cotesia glomerata TaxID=32391 RepID=A0AAV7IVV1_COTGL|nr:GPI inositol-deacylase [Cotesia glomerata]KAH0560113.1 hypothetical protein KQX54_001493 [Cotesia glomerata]
MTKIIIYISFLLLCLISFGLYLFGVANYVTDLKQNNCDMTYMFEYPQYVRIKLDNEIENKFNKFGLYAYGEGYATEKLRRMKFTGIPVLFIPGNAGSHEQVRSLASVSLRMSLKRRTPFHFDYFTISFAKSLSALYGGILQEQTVFTQHCIKKILSLYEEKLDQVILIGHSMGGIIGKSVLLQPNQTSSPASILITLASPHTPNIAFDQTSANFYQYINSQAKRLQNSVSIVSIGGGSRDLLVTCSQILDPLADLNILSTGIPNVWRAQDHLSILWCKQLIIAIVRGLFDSVDTNKRIPKIYSQREIKLKALSYHLQNRFAGKYFTKINFQPRVNFFEEGRWIQVIRPQFSYNSNDKQLKGKLNQSIVYLMIPVPVDKFSYNFLSIDAINLNTQDWLFACTVLIINNKTSEKICKSGINLTNLTRLSPDVYFRQRKTLDLNLHEISSKVTHIVVRIPTIEAEKKTLVIVHTDLYSLETRTSTFIDGSGVSWLPLPLKTVLSGDYKTVINTQSGNLRWHLDVKVPDAINFLLESVDGEDMAVYLVIEVKESWNSTKLGITEFYTLTEKDIGKSQVLRMQMDSDYLADHIVKIIVTFDPNFTYKLRIEKAGLIDRLANFVRDRWFRLYPTALGLLLLIVATRMDNDNNKVFITVGLTIGLVVYSEIYFEIFIAIGLLMVLSIATCCAIIFSGSMVHNVTARFLARALARFPAAWYGWLIRQWFDHLPFIASLILFIIISSSCAAVAMLLSVVIYFLKLTRMYEDYMEELFMATLRRFIRKIKKPLDKQVKITKSTPRNDVNPTTNIINHLLLFMIWYLTSISAIPTTFVWAKNFSYETRLTTEDTTMYICWIVLTGWGSLGLVKISPPIPQDNKFRLKIIAMFQRIVGFILLWIAQSKNIADYQWMIPPIVAISITRIVLTPFFVKKKK